MINVMGPLTAVAGVVTYVWPLAHNQNDFIAVAVIYGFASGAYISCFLGPVYELGETKDVGRRTGMTLSIGAIGALIGPPISGAINHATGSFHATGHFAGESRS
jgi:cyanate permease